MANRHLPFKFLKLLHHPPPSIPIDSRINWPPSPFFLLNLISVPLFSYEFSYIDYFARYSSSRWTNELKLLLLLKELSFEEIYLDDRLDDTVLTFHAFFPLASHYRTRSIDFYKLLLLVSKADVDRIDELPLSRHEGARRSCLHPCRISNFDGIIGRRFDFRRKT